MSRLAVLVLLCAVPAAAQAPFPGAVKIGTDWVPCDHPKAVAAGLGCTAKAPGVASAPSPCVTVGAATVCSLDQCRPNTINVYEQDDLATACAHYTLARYVPPPAPVFRLGQRVRHAYSGLQGVVIGLARTLAGVEVVTIEVTRSNGYPVVGDVVSQRNSFGTPWFPLDDSGT